MYVEYRKQIAGILNEGIEQKLFKTMDPTVIASIIIGSLDGIMIQWLMDRNLFIIQNAVDELRDLVIAGLTDID